MTILYDDAIFTRSWKTSLKWSNRGPRIKESLTSTWRFDSVDWLWRIVHINSAFNEHYSKINCAIKRDHYQIKGGKWFNTIIIKVHCQIWVWPSIVRKKWTQKSSKHFNFSLTLQWQVNTIDSTQNRNYPNIIQLKSAPLVVKMFLLISHWYESCFLHRVHQKMTHVDEKSVRTDLWP